MDELDKLDAAWGNAEPAAPGGNGDFSPIPKGKQVPVAVIEQEGGRSLQKQTPQCAVTLEVQDGPYKGKRIWHTFYLTEKNVKYLKRDLGIMGWTGDRLSSLMDATDSSLMCLGAEIVVDVKTYYSQKHQENREKNVVHYFAAPYTPPSPAGPPLRDEDAPPPRDEDEPPPPGEDLPF